MHRIVHEGVPCIYLIDSFGMVSQVHDIETKLRKLSVSLAAIHWENRIEGF